VAFAVSPDAYDRFMGRYSSQLSPQLADFAAVQKGQHVVDVGCGPGALTAELIARGVEVSAVDPSEPFVAAIRERYPSVHVHVAPAEALPFPDDAFDASIAQLVVHFMDDPGAGLREMARVTREGGTVAACVWDHAGGQSPLAPFWDVAGQLGGDVVDESQLAGAREGHLTELFERAGIRDVEETALPVRVEHSSFDDWWEPFTLGVGPAGAYVAALTTQQQSELRELVRTKLGDSFALPARAWCARGRA
jgi:SAM-dependent methyltransferase